MDFNINNMKKIITLIIIICTTTLIQAQGDLVFNKALILEMNFTDITVPEGKVWKVQGTDGGTDVSVNNSNFRLYQGLWMPEGFSFRRASAGSEAVYVNVLEVNVVAISSSSGGSSGGLSAEGFAASGIINLAFSGTNSSGNIGAIVDLGNLTVPEGKIWKLGSSSFSLGIDLSTISLGEYSGSLYVDGFIVNSTNPLYLSAGTYEVAGKASASGGGETYYIEAKLGGIEYNAN